MTQLAYDIEQACTLANIGRTSVYAAIRDGQLKARKFRRRTVILHEDLTAFLKELPELRAHPAPTGSSEETAAKQSQTSS
jgi:excisionase family DNA binding protein